MRKTLDITFLSEWQVGSGLGDGHLADTMLARDHFGVLWLPGRAVKGALREGATRLCRAREDLGEALELFWGTPSDGDRPNRPGLLRVTPASLPGDMVAMLRALPADRRETMVRDMTCNRTQTALDDDRQVRSGSLRTLECGIPGLTFRATLETDIPDGYAEAWVERYFVAVCAAVKSMGGNRSRGLGQCVFSLDGVPAGPVVLPEKLSCTGGAA